MLDLYDFHICGARGRINIYFDEFRANVNPDRCLKALFDAKVSETSEMYIISIHARLRKEVKEHIKKYIAT